MKIIHKLVVALSLVLLSTSVLSAQDLSKYRSFSLGMRLAEVAKQVDATPDDVTVIQKSPASIQELTWWPAPSDQSSASADPVQTILFSFYNGELYKIVVTYSGSATRGLTPDDLVRAVSAKYGAATMPVAPVNASTNGPYDNTQEAIAFWEDSQDSVALSDSSLSGSFQLVLFSKRLNSQAEAVNADAIRQEREAAPENELARVKKEADALEAVRQANLKAFRF
ncbi:MAG: hypothetical protein WBM24_10200 [Candidatus Sulfotelmatobacter sp.]|jgi:hypothetical protein